MGVRGQDQRRVIQPEENDFNIFPLPAIAAIDTQIGNVILTK